MKNPPQGEEGFATLDAPDVARCVLPAGLYDVRPPGRERVVVLLDVADVVDRRVSRVTVQHPQVAARYVVLGVGAPLAVGYDLAVAHDGLELETPTCLNMTRAAVARASVPAHAHDAVTWVACTLGLCTDEHGNYPTFLRRPIAFLMRDNSTSSRFGLFGPPPLPDL